MPPVPVLVIGDASRLEQVLVNLLSNAIKYTPAPGRISVRLEATRDLASIAVRDNGVGISEADQARIFTLFTRATRTEIGLGIGLALARQLVEMHGGTIRCDSDGPGTGSRFTVNLPIRKAPPSSLPLVDHGMPACLGRRVLVVDDNHDAADMTAALLEHHGCDVRAVYCGEAAIETARTFQPQLVLLDLGMPGMDGWETCRRLRSQPWGSEVVIAAVTGWGQEEDRRGTTHAGFDHHLVKPVDPNALMRLMEEKKP
jgi:CheY-like chemotaxis protein